MFEIYPDIDELITIALLNKSRRYKVAREIRNLDPNVNLDDLMKLIGIVAEDTDSIEFSELGISLALLMEKMSNEKANELLERLLSKEYGGMLTGIILGYTKKKFDKDLIFEIIRRLILSENSETRLAGLNALQSQYKNIGKEAVMDILADIFSSSSSNVRRDIPIIISTIRGILDNKTFSELLKRIAIEDEEGFRAILNMIEEGILRIPNKILLDLAGIIKSKGDRNLMDTFVKTVLNSNIKDKDKILRSLDVNTG